MHVLCTYLAVTTFKYYFTHLKNSHGHRIDDVNENCKVSRSCSMHYPVDSTIKIYQYPVLQRDGHGFESILLEQLVSKTGLLCKSPGLRHEYN